MSNEQKPFNLAFYKNCAKQTDVDVFNIVKSCFELSTLAAYMVPVVDHLKVLAEKVEDLEGQLEVVTMERDALKAMVEQLEEERMEVHASHVTST